MNAPIQTLPAQQKSVLITMAERYGMAPQNFEQTLRATVVPQNVSREQFAAFLVVANSYQLNPLTREIYAFPARGGGIQPIVSVDGWLNIINRHPQANGIEFDDHVTGDKVTAITCRIWRKDRDKPIVVTEYLTECYRATDPWKQYPRRMLRHKALIQCARYAFGFAGIVDPDEAERMGSVSPMHDVTPRDNGPPAPPGTKLPPHNPQTGEIAADDMEEIAAGWSDQSPPTASDSIDEAAWLNDLAGAFNGCEDFSTLAETQRDVMMPQKGRVSKEAWSKAQELAEDNLRRVQGAAS